MGNIGFIITGFETLFSLCVGAQKKTLEWKKVAAVDTQLVNYILSSLLILTLYFHHIADFFDLGNLVAMIDYYFFN